LDFTLTSGTLFASHKLPLRCYLAAIAIFCNEVKGKPALALSRDLVAWRPNRSSNISRKRLKPKSMLGFVTPTAS